MTVSHVMEDLGKETDNVAPDARTNPKNPYSKLSRIEYIRCKLTNSLVPVQSRGPPLDRMHE